MKIKLLIALLPISGVALVPVNALAGATAQATVTANIVPAVMVSMPGSVMMQQVPQGVTQQNESISLSTSAVDKTAKFNIKSSGNYTYGMTVSSRVNVSGRSGNNMSINNFRLPLSNGYTTSDNEHELHMVGALEKGADKKAGSYSGQVYLTAHFD